MTTKRVSADVRCLSLCARWHHWNPRWLTEPRKHINNTAFDKRRGLCFIRRGSRSVSAPANPLNYFHYLTKCSWQSGIAVVDCAANGLCPFHKAPTAAATTPQTVFQSTPIFHWTGVATPAAYLNQRPFTGKEVAVISDYLAFQSDSPISC